MVDHPCCLPVWPISPRLPAFVAKTTQAACVAETAQAACVCGQDHPGCLCGRDHPGCGVLRQLCVAWQGSLSTRRDGRPVDVCRRQQTTQILVQLRLVLYPAAANQHSAFGTAIFVHENTNSHTQNSHFNLYCYGISVKILITLFCGEYNIIDECI